MFWFVSVSQLSSNLFPATSSSCFQWIIITYSMLCNIILRCKLHTKNRILHETYCQTVFSGDGFTEVYTAYQAQYQYQWFKSLTWSETTTTRKWYVQSGNRSEFRLMVLYARFPHKGLSHWQTSARFAHHTPTWTWLCVVQVCVYKE